ITAPAGYQISDNSVSGFSGSMSLSPVGGTVTAKTIYVRLDGTSTTSSPVSGNISIASTGATTQTLAVSGTVNKLPAISTQPQNQIKSVGDNVTFSVTTSNVTNYQWEYYNSGIWNVLNNASAVVGANTATVTISSLQATQSNIKLRCKLTNDCDIIYSDEATLTVIAPSTQKVLFVNKSVTSGNGSGNSWANAIPELADALKWARQNKDTDKWSSENPLQIWVASGTYYPLYNAADGAFTTNGNQDNAFVVVKDVHLYGGFAGTETDTEARNLTNISNKTILSGDI